MSSAMPTLQQFIGGKTVTRDADTGRITRVQGALQSVPGVKNWRGVLRALIGNGSDQFSKIIELAKGVPQHIKLEDGREMEPQPVPLAIQLEANKWLLEMAFGKAVPQTEIMKAEASAVYQEQLAAMSEEELEKLAGVVREEALGYGAAREPALLERVPGAPAKDDQH